MNNASASLYIGFKGKNNSSSILAQAISENHCLLTNSFGGLKKDIELLNSSYEWGIMFGLKEFRKARKGSRKRNCNIFRFGLGRNIGQVKR